MKNPLLITAALIACAGCIGEADPYRLVGQLASERIEIAAEVSEVIVSINVEEGEAVSAGQLLLLQNSGRARALLAEADAAVAQHKARLDELLRGPRRELIAQGRANLDGAKNELAFRSAELLRAEKLFERKLASEDALDTARAAADAADAALRERRARLEELLSGTTSEELEQAEQLLLQAKARRDAAAFELGRYNLQAPADGVVDTRLFEPGERPSAGQPVLILLGGEQVHAEVFVPESLRVRVHPGLEASVYVDGLEQELRGRVRWVASESAFTPYYALTERDRGRLSYLAKIDILNSTDRLPEGVPVEVVLHLDEPR